MLRSSLPLGRIFGVDVRMHISFLLLLVIAVVYSVTALHDPGRGIALWLTLCLAVFVRELARAIAAAYVGLRLRAVFLLPIGGIMAFSSSDGVALQASGPDKGAASKLNTRWVTASGPLANFALGLLILGISLATDPRVSLFTQPWIGVHHILRSLIWMQILLGAVSLLPTSALPLRPFLRSAPDAPNTQAAAKLPAAPTIGLGMLLAMAMIVAGVLLPDVYWLSILGLFVLLYLQIGKLHQQAGPNGESILVREVMLTEYTLLSSSDTLRGALDHTIHSLQDVFPVVRGNRLVGSISRQTMAEHLVSGGDSYLQGAMVKNLQLAAPDEKLVEALRRASTLGASEFLPVVQEGALIGILTSQSLARAVHQVKLTRPPTNSREK
jgi:CBS domain-containing protein